MPGPSGTSKTCPEPAGAVEIARKRSFGWGVNLPPGRSHRLGKIGESLLGRQLYAHHFSPPAEPIHAHLPLGTSPVSFCHARAAMIPATPISRRNFLRAAAAAGTAVAAPWLIPSSALGRPRPSGGQRPHPPGPDRLRPAGEPVVGRPAIGDRPDRTGADRQR